MSTAGSHAAVYFTSHVDPILDRVLRRSFAVVDFIQHLEYSSTVIRPCEKVMRALRALSTFPVSLKWSSNSSLKSFHVPRDVGGFAPIVLLRKFSAHTPAVPDLMQERTREIRSSSVLYRSDSVTKRRRHWSMKCCDSVLLPVKLSGSFSFPRPGCTVVVSGAVPPPAGTVPAGAVPDVDMMFWGFVCTGVCASE